MSPGLYPSDVRRCAKNVDGRHDENAAIGILNINRMDDGISSAVTQSRLIQWVKRVIRACR